FLLLSTMITSGCLIVVLALRLQPHRAAGGTVEGTARDEFLMKDGVVMQDKNYNCGAAALKMIFDHFDVPSTMAEIEHGIGLTERGSSMLGLQKLADTKGLRAQGWQYSLNDLSRASLPAILLVNNDHYVVVDSIGTDDDVYLRDPAR